MKVPVVVPVSLLLLIFFINTFVLFLLLWGFVFVCCVFLWGFVCFVFGGERWFVRVIV